MDTLRQAEYSWETLEKWDNPSIYLLQTTAFNEQDIRVLQYALTEDEIDKSRRFRFRNDRDSYIITHGVFRLKLSNFLNEKPREIRVENGFLGKPYLPDYPGIHFNLSHSKGISLLGFDTKNEIGVDVEEINTAFEWMPVAEKFFTSDEQNLIKSSGENEMYSFYRLWTRKEALVKAKGSGINEANLKTDVRIDDSDDFFFLKTLNYLHTYIITVAVSKNSGKVDVLLPGNNCFTFNVQ